MVLGVPIFEHFRALIVKLLQAHQSSQIKFYGRKYSFFFDFTTTYVKGLHLNFRIAAMILTLLHSVKPKLHTILALLSTIGLKIIYNFGLSECNRVRNCIQFRPSECYNRVKNGKQFWPLWVLKLYTLLAFLSAIGLKIVYNFGLSECNRVKIVYNFGLSECNRVKNCIQFWPF